MGEVTAVEVATMMLVVATTGLLLRQLGRLTALATTEDQPDTRTLRRRGVQLTRTGGAWLVSVGLFLLTQDPAAAVGPLMVGGVLVLSAPLMTLST